MTVPKGILAKKDLNLKILAVLERLARYV